MATTAVSVYGTVKQSQAQSQAARERSKQAKEQAKAAEIKRLKGLRATLAQNITSSAAGGMTLEGTPSQIIEGNIKAADYDVKMLRGGAASAVRGYENQARNARQAGMISAVGSIVGGAGQAYGAYKDTPVMPETTTVV